MSDYTKNLALQEARTQLARLPVYLDTETTGTDDTAEVVEIAVIDHTGAVLMESYVRPLRPIPAAATAVHHITEAMVAQAPTWKELWPQVRAVLEGRLIAIYNAEYDVRLMQQSHKLHNMPWDLPEAEFFCVMKNYAQFKGDWNSYRGSYKWHKLEDAGRQCRLSLPNSHRAADDAQLARAVLQAVAGPMQSRLF